MAKRRNINERGDISRYLEELANLERRAAMPTAESRGIRVEMEQVQSQQKQLSSQISQAISARDYSDETLRSLGMSQGAIEKLSGAPNYRRGVELSRFGGVQQDVLEKRTLNLQNQYEQAAARRAGDAARQFENRIMSMAAPERLEAETRSLSRQSGFVLGAGRYARASDDISLERGIARNRRTQSRLGDELIEAARSIYEPGGRERFEEVAGQLQAAKAKGGELLGARDIMRRTGMDLEGRMRAYGGIASEIESRRYSAGIREQVATGGTGSLKQEIKNLVGLEDTFMKLKKAVEEATDTTSDSFKELRDQTDEAASAFKRQKDLVDEMSKQGGGRGGRGIDNVRAVLGIGGAAADVARYGFVQSNLDKLAVQAQLAQSINAESFDVLGGARGNMAALRRITTGTYARNRVSAVELGGRESAIQTVEGGLQAVDAATRALGSTSDASIGAVFSGGTSSIVKAINEASPAAAQSARTFTDLAKGISQGQVQANRQALGVGLEDAINAVPDAARQAAYDFRMQARDVTIGMGTGRSSVYDRFISASSMNQLASFGIDATRQTQLLGLASREMGANFIRGGYGTLAAAGRAERAGILSAEQYIGQVGAMTNVGGGQKNLEEVLANAVARGVDNAKAISGLTGAITGLASASASRGIDVSLGATRGVLQGVSALSRTGMTEEMKQAAAVSSLARLDQLTGGTSLNLSTMLERQAMADMGLSQVEQINFQRMTATQISQAQQLAAAGDIQGLRNLELMTGLSGKLVDEKGNVNRDFIAKGVNAKIAKGRGGAGGVLASNSAIAEKEAYQRNELPLDKLSNEAKNLLAMEGLVGTGGRYAAGAAPGAAIPGGPGGELGAAQLSAAAAAGAGVEQITQAVSMGGGKQFMQKTAQQQMQALSQLDIQKQGIQAAQAAEKMTLDTGKFDQSVDTFSKAANKLADSIKEKTVVISVQEMATKIKDEVVNAMKNPKGTNIPQPGRDVK